MPVRDALACCPTAEFLSADPLQAPRERERWLDALEAVSPTVEPDTQDIGTVLVDLEGLDQLHGGDLGVVKALAATTKQALGLEPCIGVADGPFAARAAAVSAIPSAPAIVPRGQAPRYLTALGVEQLPLGRDVTHRLRTRFGIRTIGEFAALPLGAVQAQFGLAGREAWHLAHGRDRRRLRPRVHAAHLGERLQFPSPTTSGEALLTAARHLVTRLLQRPELEQRAVRRVTVWIQVADGPNWERSVTLQEASRDAQRLRIVIRRELERLWAAGQTTLPGPVAEIGLEFADLCTESGKQAALWTGNGRRTKQLDDAVRQLRARYSEPTLFRVVEVEPWSRFPERQAALIAYDP